MPPHHRRIPPYWSWAWSPSRSSWRSTAFSSPPSSRSSPCAAPAWRSLVNQGQAGARSPRPRSPTSIAAWPLAVFRHHCGQPRARLRQRAGDPPRHSPHAHGPARGGGAGRLHPHHAHAHHLYARRLRRADAEDRRAPGERARRPWVRGRSICSGHGAPDPPHERVERVVPAQAGVQEQRRGGGNSLGG